MNKDIINLIKDSASTFMNIALMTQYRMRYLQDKDAEDKGKMYTHAILAGVGILSLLTIGVLGVMESRSKNEVCRCSRESFRKKQKITDWDMIGSKEPSL